MESKNQNQNQIRTSRQSKMLFVMSPQNKLKHAFLLTFFNEDSGYEEKQINGFWLIKQFQKKLSQWVVAIYTPQSYKKKKKHQLRLRPRGTSRSEDK